VLCPGGVQEVTLLKNDKEIVLYLSKRLGFVKLALQHGAPLVPVFSFGLRNSFSFWIPKGKFFHSLGRQFGVLPMAFFGLWGLPLGPSKPCDYGIVVGKPIPVPCIADPSIDELKRYHALYIEELTRIYELKKAEFGLEHVSLRVV
jgi:diacylglycerol O-acyltransferase 2, plant